VYSPRLIELFHSRAHGGDLPDATHFGQAGTPGGGPFIQIWLRVKDGVVEAARWRTYGCPAAIACAEAACLHTEGCALSRLARVDADEVSGWVGGLPDGKDHCAALAAQALRLSAAGGGRISKCRASAT